MNAFALVNGSHDRWLNLLVWAIIVWVAWELFVQLTVRRENQVPPEWHGPTNPRQLSP